MNILTNAQDTSLIPRHSETREKVSGNETSKSHVYRRIGLSCTHSLFRAHRLLGACCLLDKICLDKKRTALIRQKFGVGEAKLQVE